MKIYKRIVCSVLALTMTVGLASCSSSKLSHKQLCKLADKMGLEEIEKTSKFFKEVGNLREDHGVYIHAKDRKAQNVYDTVTNRFDNYSDYDVTEATFLFVLDDNSLQMYAMYTFEDAKDAEDFVDEYVEVSMDRPDEGQGKGYSYLISSVKSDNYDDRYIYTGIYLDGKTVLVVRVSTGDEDTVDDFCEALKIVSPTEY